MTGLQIYEWLKKWGNRGASSWYQPGVGRVLAPCVDRSQWVVIGCLCVVALCGCNVPLPPAPPIPQPGPPPIVDPVTPVNVDRWLIVLEETADRTAETSALLADPWWHNLPSGVRFRVYDRDQPEAADVVRAVGNAPLPALVIVDSRGKRLHAGTLPGSVAEIQKLIGANK